VTNESVNQRDPVERTRAQVERCGEEERVRVG
jgi:hypothetical protein